MLHVIKNQKINFLNIDASLPMSKIAGKILDHIYTKYITIIRQVSISIDDIKTEFTKAYQKIYENDTNITVQVIDQELILANFIFTFDPIYSFCKTICRLLKKLPFTSNNSPSALKHEFEVIMGKSLPIIAKQAKENIKKYPNEFQRRYGSPLPMATLLDFYKSPNINLFYNMFYIDNGNELIKKYLNKQYDDTLVIAYILFYKYTVLQNSYEELYSLYDKIKIIKLK
jgi:hypothetical protein